MGVDVVTVGVVCADIMALPVDDLPAPGKLTLVPQLEVRLGGLAAVTAATVTRLGGSSAVIGYVGNDGFGDFLEKEVSRRGVDTSRLRRHPEARSSATVVLISSEGERSFLHQRGATEYITAADIDMELVRQAKVFHWGGPAATPGLDGEPMGRVMANVRGAGVVTSMDTCFDGQGRWFQLIEHALPHLDIVFSSYEEACHYTGEQTPDAIADFFLRQGVGIAVIKLGADGLLVKGRGETHRLPAHAVRVVDTTGAGDAACGGFLYGLVRDWPLLDCARLSNAVGALTTQAVGGAEALMSLDQAMALMEGAQC